MGGLPSSTLAMLFFFVVVLFSGVEEINTTAAAIAQLLARVCGQNLGIHRIHFTVLRLLGIHKARFV